ncbi:hypothetical protein Tco_0387518, partial [Tanacetum coccineum]
PAEAIVAAEVAKLPIRYRRSQSESGLEVVHTRNSSPYGIACLYSALVPEGKDI